MEKLSVLSIGLLAKIDQKPLVIDDLHNGQGTFNYNHNIIEVMVIEDSEGGITVTTDPKKATGTMWQYDSLRVEYPKTRKNIYATLLRLFQLVVITLTVVQDGRRKTVVSLFHSVSPSQHHFGNSTT